MTHPAGILAVLFALGSFGLLPNAAGGWQVSIDGEGGSSRYRDDTARALVVDGSGDVVAVGYVRNASSRRQFTAIKFGASDGAELWRYGLATESGYDTARAVELGPSGDLFVVGTHFVAGRGRDFAVVKLSASDGREIWRRDVDGPRIDERIIPNDWAGSVAVDAAGNVVAGGRLQEFPPGLGRCSGDQSILCRTDTFCANAGAGVCEPSPRLAEEFAVVKFAGTDGRELWRGTFSDPEPASGSVSALALDASGDVIAAGKRGVALVVVKFSGATGAELWRYETRGTSPPPRQQNRARALALDRAGDVFAVGRLRNEGTGNSFAVIKLSGGNGAEMWRREIDSDPGCGYDEARSVAIDATGNVIVAGQLVEDRFPGCVPSAENQFVVIKFAGSDGSELWRFPVRASNQGYYAQNTVAITPSGDVLTASRTGGGFTVFRLSAADGREFWRSSIGGTGVGRYDRISALGLDLDGNPVVAGAVNNAYGTEDFMVAKLDAADGKGGVGVLDNHPIPGRSLKVFGHERRRLILSSVSRGSGYYGARQPGILAPNRTSRANPTKSGATLEVINPWWTESHTIPLPASNWQEIGKRRFKGYVYRDPHRELGPCTRIAFRNGRFLRISCKGDGIGLSLNDRPQHMLLIQLTFGTDVKLRHFAFFAPPTVVKDTPKVFNARHAPALDSYPGIWDPD